MSRIVGAICAVLGLSALAVPGRSTAAPGDIFAEVMATPLDAGGNWFSPGHAFVCISMDLDSGIKEECFGFYPHPPQPGSAKPDAAVVGAPGFTNEFKQDPDRFSRVDWSIKKKISEDQRRAFYQQALDADRAPYTYRANNCGDFVSTAVDSFGWSNVPKSVLPNPYVRDLIAANIDHFVIERQPKAGSITRKGSQWIQHIPTSADRTYDDENRHDDTYIYIKDGRNNVELRLPMHGGGYDYNYNGQGWHATGRVSVAFDS